MRWLLQILRRGPSGRRTAFGRVLAVLAVTGGSLSGCAPRTQPEHEGSRIQRDEVVFGLTFEERMAIPPALTRLRSDAERRATEIYDPFRSREDAMRNEEYFAQIYAESKERMLAEKGISEADLAQITAEYQASRGAELR